MKSIYDKIKTPKKLIKAMRAQTLLDKANADLKAAKETIENQDGLLDAERRARIKAEETAALAAVEILELKKKVTELKAKLYDALIGDKETK